MICEVPRRLHIDFPHISVLQSNAFVHPQKPAELLPRAVPNVNQAWFQDLSFGCDGFRMRTGCRAGLVAELSDICLGVSGV